MTAGKTPGQLSWTARNAALAVKGGSPADVLADLHGTWDYLSPGQQEAEEAGAQAVAGPVLWAENQNLRAEVARLRGQLQAVRLIAERDAPECGREQFASPKSLLAGAILDQLDPG